MNNKFKNEMIEHNNLMKNASGYPDPTAYQAIMNCTAEQEAYERYRKLIGCLLRVCELSGFSVEERFVLKDNQTGKIWR